MIPLTSALAYSDYSIIFLFNTIQMINRPYLDRIATSAHLPKQPGQNGYCSKKLIPDLSCTGLRSELEPAKMPITTQDGKLTKQYRIKAYSKMRECQRGLNILNSQEDVFKVDHRLYIDSLLGSIELDKKDKHERRMRHWKKDKNNLGFTGSFELHNSNNININDKNDSNNEYHEDFESHDSFIEYGTVISANEYSENEFDALNNHVDTMKNTPQAKFESYYNNVNNNKTNNESLLLHTIPSVLNNKNPKSSTKKIRTYSTMALFESLLENTNSPTRKFGGGN